MAAVGIAIDATTTLDTWAPCGLCWGQRRIFEDCNGEGLVPRVCPACLGVGERPVPRSGRDEGLQQGDCAKGGAHPR